MTVSLGSRLACWKTTPMRFRTACGFLRASRPRRETLPPVGGMSVERILNNVVFPPPFSPRTPKISPRRTESETPFNAMCAP